jgi:hypothetical protein
MSIRIDNNGRLALTAERGSPFGEDRHLKALYDNLQYYHPQSLAEGAP